jgi:alpha-L-fucosidase
MLSRGDYATPEQGLPVAPPGGPWELCLTINDSWGFQHRDGNHKSVSQLVRYFTETIGMGGNLLLDVGPREDGTITAEQSERLEGLGAWISRHGESVYGTTAGLPAGYHYGPATLSADRRTLYLFCFDAPRETVSLRGLRNHIKRVTVLGTGQELAHHVTGGFGDVPGMSWIAAPPPSALDPNATVLAVQLDGELAARSAGLVSPGRTGQCCPLSPGCCLATCGCSGSSRQPPCWPGIVAWRGRSGLSTPDRPPADC